MTETLPVWRSMLFVPVVVERFVEGAHRRGADAVILDLEDSIVPADKPRARDLVPAAARRVARGGADVIVRVNRPWRLCVRDLEAVVCAEVGALMLPKTESAGHVLFVAEILAELEAERGLPPGHTRLFPVIESAGAFLRMREIAAAHARIVGLSLGSEDFSLDMGMSPDPDGLLFPKQQMAICARAAGVMPLGFVGSVASIADDHEFRATVRRARRLGFLGAAVIHPGQVAILNEEFGPSADEVDVARRLVAAFEAGGGASRGVIRHEGRMVDLPVVERARRVLQRQAAIAARGWGS